MHVNRVLGIGADICLVGSNVNPLKIWFQSNIDQVPNVCQSNANMVPIWCRACVNRSTIRCQSSADALTIRQSNPNHGQSANVPIYCQSVLVQDWHRIDTGLVYCWDAWEGWITVPRWDKYHPYSTSFLSSSCLVRTDWVWIGKNLQFIGDWFGKFVTDPYR